MYISMKTTLHLVALVLLAAALAGSSTVFGQGSAFTYQGRLNDGGSPANGKYDFRFRLASDPQGNNYVGPAVLISGVQVTSGLFLATLDFGSVFTGSNYWLEVDVRTNGASGYSTLSPLQPVSSVPYAQYAMTPAGPPGPQGNAGAQGPPGPAGAPGASPLALMGTNVIYVDGFVGIGRTNPATALDVNGTITGLSFSGNGAGLTALNGGALANGSVTAAQLANASVGTTQLEDGSVTTAKIADSSVMPLDLALSSFGTTFWQAGGNSGTTAGLNFLGTADNQPLEIKANATRALRFEPNTNGAPNVIGGSPVNFVDSGVVGATIAGGGAVNGNFFLGAGSNHVAAIFGTIGGGRMNSVWADHATIGGGLNNTVQSFAYDSVIGGGFGNTIQSNAFRPVIAGGSGNTSAASFAAIGGGFGNSIGLGGYAATVSGGYNNLASGNYGAVPGGYGNVAAGQYSFAAGFGANANHLGAFVWADGTGTPFASTATNQFSVRAGGGARFVTSGAGMTLDGQSVATVNALSNLDAGTITSGTLGDARLSANVPLLNASQTFAGQNTFHNLLTVVGNLQIGANSADYRQVLIGGGNSLGFIYGSYPGLSDGIHFGYNAYYNANGNLAVIHSDGGTSRISAGYGYAALATGTAGAAPVNRLYVSTSSVSVENATFNNSSDRNAKCNFVQVDPAEILDKVAQLPISEWSYKSDSSTRHIGPMAQDFYWTLNIGTDERHIAPIDEGGVALAAIQAVSEKLKQKDAEIQNLRNRLERLQAAVDRLAAGK